MKNIINTFLTIISPEYKKYAIIIWKNRFRDFFRRKQEHKYLFVLSPPYCGSTLFNEVISSSNAVSVNNPYGTREGQTLPTVRRVMFDHKKRWDKKLDFDWNSIKEEWHKYWDLRKPILLEKSPPNIIRAKSIEKAFKNSFFIIFYRNPYAQCESLIRRSDKTGYDAAHFAINCLIAQKENILFLKRKTQLSYETLTSSPDSVPQLLSNFIPELIDVNINKKFSAHNYLNMKMEIRNLNSEKIKNLTESQLKEINSVFFKNIEVLNYFNYALIK